MKKKCLIILLLAMFLMPCKVFAAGGFGVSNTSVSMYPGETKTITITSDNVVGRLDVSSSNNGIASVSPKNVFIQNPGSSGSITITANKVGITTISVVASDNFATMDEEILAGQTKTITITVKEKPSPIILSKNNNINTLNIEGYNLAKIDNNNYTLTVSNDVTSVNVIATAEDSKAKVTGVGVKELQTGENNIEVIVTAESGAQNKFNIKVTRKDGYYLEDLDLVLNKSELQDADIIIDADSKIKKEEIAKIKDSKKTIRLNYCDENKKIVYSWILNGKEILTSEELTTSISFASENTKEIDMLSNYANGLHISFKHTGDLPTGTKIKLYVGDKFEDGSIVNLYRYNNNKKQLDFVKDNLNVVDGYVAFDIEHCSEYFITMSNIGIINKEESSSLNIFMIFTIIELIVIIALVIFIKLKTNKKVTATNNTGDISESNVIEFNNFDNSIDMSTIGSDNVNTAINDTIIIPESSVNNNTNNNASMTESETIVPNNNVNNSSDIPIININSNTNNMVSMPNENIKDLN